MLSRKNDFPTLCTMEVATRSLEEVRKEMESARVPEVTGMTLPQAAVGHRLYGKAANVRLHAERIANKLPDCHQPLDPARLRPEVRDFELY